MAVPYTFQTATGSIPLSQLDSNFSTAITIGNTAVVLGETITTINNLSLANVTISSVASAFPNNYLANSNVIVGTTTLTLGSTVTSINGLSLSNVTVSSGNVTISNVTTTNVTATTANVTTANVSTLIITGNQTSLGNVAITGNVSANIVTVAAGAVGTPSITTTGDTNTGIFFPAADTIAFSEGGVEAMRIDSSRNLGIGTASPAALLDVDKSQNSTTSIRVGNTNAGSSANSRLIAVADAGNIQIKAMSSTNTTYGAADCGVINCDNMAGGLRFSHNDTVGMTFSATGNLGIGTASPTRTLDVSAASATVFVTSSTGTNRVYYGTSNTGGGTYFGRENSAGNAFGTTAYSSVVWSEGAYPLVFATNNAERMRIDSSGNVGIGTSSPAGNLQISGSGDRSLMVTGGTAGTVSVQLGDSAAAGQGGMSYDNSVDALFLKSAGSERMRIDSSGNVGIGTSSPSNKLEISGGSIRTINNTSGRITFNNGTTEAYVGFNGSGQTILDSGALPLTINSQGANYIVLNTNSTERMRIDSSGNAYIETGLLWQYAPTPTTKAAAATLTAAELATDIITLTGTTYTITLPTGTALDTYYTGVPAVNIGYDFHIVNTASGIITIAVGASGMTSVGLLTVAATVSAHFRLRRTAANTYILYRLS